MAKPILTSRYIRDAPPEHLQNYVRYISTREGVEKADESKKNLPATSAQKELIRQLLKDMQESRDMLEYEDYHQRPTIGNASEFITRALERNLDMAAMKENYVDYLANRPRVERIGEHGLFTDAGRPVILAEVQKEVSGHKGPVWSHVVSLRREDAARLGYDSAREWMALLRSKRAMLSRHMKIDSADLRWYAAFHNEGHHPHVHLMVYSAKGNDGFLTKAGMDLWLEDPENLAYKARAEKYAKITAKTIISSGADSSSYGQNAFFYDAAEGLLTSVLLLIAEYCPKEQRHIVSVFKLIQDLLAPSPVKGKNQFQLLMQKLPPEHKAKWFAGAALNTADQAMASVLSTDMSRLNAFLDSEMEQILCFDGSMDTETFCNSKSAIFIVLPEEDNTKYFMVSLFQQQIYREMLFSAGRSRRISMVPIIQSFAQLQKNYGKEGSEIIIDNCQDILFGGFAPNSESAEVLSKALGNKTVLSGSISRGKNDPSQSLQMIQRPLMTPDELKSLPKGHFILAKTGCHPMRTELRLFFKWGIEFEEGYVAEQHAARAVSYADRLTLEQEILRRRMDDDLEEFEEPLVPSGTPVSGGMGQGQVTERTVPLQPHRPTGRPPLRTD